MGSLMGGWGSHSLDPKSATLKRNHSLTKDEIDAYWKSKNKIEQEHLTPISNLSPDTTQVRKMKEPEKKIQKSITLPVNVEIDTNLEELSKKKGWWRKSSWAFLNEPPVIEAATNKYTPQFHVANLGSSSKHNHGHGISSTLM